MKTHLFATILLAAGCSLAVFADNKDKTNPTADRYNVTDANGVLAFGKSYYELDGRPAGANGNFYSTSNANWSIKQWPDKSTKKHIATYLHFPKCKSGAQIELTTTGAVQLKVVVTSMETGRTIATNTVDIKKGARQWVDIFPETQFYENGWYKVDFECTKGASYVGEFFNWKFSKTGSTEKIYTADYMSSPSVHLSGWKTTDPDAPQPAYYDWVYEEVMVPEESAIVGTYCMSLGVLHGYMGIQIDSDKDYPIIFSMWDNGSTDEDPNLPQYLRSGALDWEQGVTIARFANEGTGAQAKYRTGKNWIPGKWVKFISNARPEVINVEIDDPANPGKKKTITYTNTLCSAWFMADGLDDDWHYIATIRQSGANNYFDGWYSFLENYNWPTGQWQRKAYYRNGGLHSLSNGKWYHANKVGFGHTDGGDKYGDRRDYGQGKTEDFDDCFFMSTGGYANNPVQNQQVVPLKRNFMPVDQATLDRLTARVDAAIRKEQVVAMKENVSNACTVFPQEDFKVVAFSDQTIENSVNKAESVFDGDEGTYWHSQWSGGEKPYPHTLTVQINQPEEHSIGQISLVQKRASNYRAKTLTVFTSDDNKTWNKHETVTLEDAERPNAEFTAPIQAPYVKLQFDKGYGGNLLCINEIYFKSAPSLDDLKRQAQSVIDQENQFNGYSSEQLADLKRVYADGSVTDFAALSAALTNLAANGQPLKFGRVDEMKNLSSFKAYQIHSLNNLGELIANADGTVTTTTDPINVVDPLNNWHIIHCAKTGDYCIYNLGLGKFLKPSGSSFTLVDDFTPVKVAYNNDSKAFRFGSSTRNWEVRDNYVAQPSYEIAAGIIAAVERAADLAGIQAKADAARALLAAAQADAALDFDKSYAGEYDVAILADVLDRKDATIDEIAAASDALRASTMPATDRYYRIINAVRPTADSRDNYLQLAVSGSTHSFASKNTTEFGASPSETGTAEAFRLYTFERAANDTTFYVCCTADQRYLMTQGNDQGISAQAREYAISYDGQRLFRLASGGKFLSINSTNKLADVSTKDAAGRFYFREVTELENAISLDESGYGTTCLPAPIVLPEGVEALIATDIHDGYLDVRPLNDFLAPEDADVVPAYVPVILRSTNRTALAPTTCDIYFKLLTPTAEGKSSNDVIRAINKVNILAGSTHRMTITKNDYIFSTPSIVLEKSASTSLLANKAYIPAATLPYEQSGLLPVGLEGLEGLDGIGLVINDPAAPASSVVYDLQGRATTAQHGVFIVGGRKVVR